MFVARDDPLDHYLAHHPRAVFGRPIEATVTDPTNPYVLGPQLCCAAAELPLRPEDLRRLRRARPPRPQLEELVAAGQLRRRPGRLVLGRAAAAPTSTSAAAAGSRSRSSRRAPAGCWAPSTATPPHATVHDGALYVHRGETFVVDEFDVEDACAVVHADSPEWTTVARDVTDLGDRLDRPQPAGWARSPRTPAWST